jgi:hypothetical protein
MMLQERFHMVLIDDPGALGLRKNKVGEEEEADPTVERKPVNLTRMESEGVERDQVVELLGKETRDFIPSDDEHCPRLSQQYPRQDDPIHQPW